MAGTGESLGKCLGPGKHMSRAVWCQVSGSAMAWLGSKCTTRDQG